MRTTKLAGIPVMSLVECIRANPQPTQQQQEELWYIANDVVPINEVM